LSRLQTLNAERNRLSEVPATLGRCSQLGAINFSYNRMTVRRWSVACCA
jgi:Leucine-rich repeat (LRR) protein